MFTCKFRMVIGVLLILALVPGLSGCGGSLGAQLLKVTAAAILPDSWTSAGGFVKILADVVGDGIVREVRALIRKLGSDEVTSVPLVLDKDGQYSATIQMDVPADGSSPQDYTVTVTATDVAGQSASDSVAVEVPPAEPTAP